MIYVTLDENNKVIGIRQGKNKLPHEMELNSYDVSVGDEKLLDGTFKKVKRGHVEGGKVVTSKKKRWYKLWLS